MAQMAGAAHAPGHHLGQSLRGSVVVHAPHGTTAGHHRTAQRSAPETAHNEPGEKNPSFFRSGAAPRGGVCAVCLGRHEHTFSKCDGAKLWDGSAGAAKKTEGRLVADDGFPLCFDWQVPKGCSSTSHPDRHRCSGCGKGDHGAQTCPRAEKA
jgi:hypothetical protein